MGWGWLSSSSSVLLTELCGRRTEVLLFLLAVSWGPVSAAVVFLGSTIHSMTVPFLAASLLDVSDIVPSSDGPSASLIDFSVMRSAG